jgi:hypothetical protein
VQGEQARRNDDSLNDVTGAARIALLALRASAPSVGHRVYLLVPSLGSLSPDSAALTISRIPKPVRCAGRVDGIRLVIECQALSDPGAIAHQRAAAARLTAFWNNAAQAACGGDRYSQVVLRNLRDQHDTLALTFGALRTWFRDYKMHYTLKEVRGKETGAGPCLVLEMGGEEAKAGDSHELRKSGV